MKNMLITILPIVFYCASCRSTKDGMQCIENKKFKKEFFTQINIVEKNISLNQDSSFQKALIFLSNYAPVSFYETVNYARIYPSQALTKDKKVWVEWYEYNKCKNLQLKDKYTVPKQYKEFFEH